MDKVMFGLSKVINLFFYIEMGFLRGFGVFKGILNIVSI